MSESTGPSRLALFQRVLVGLGFQELLELPQLTLKLVRSTEFRFMYSDFITRTKPHINTDLLSTLEAWIEERGPAFRDSLPLLLYYLWENDLFREDVAFSDRDAPLVPDTELSRIRKICERIYFGILVKRFKVTLEQFDPSRFVTIYAVDAMGGIEFEDFLVRMFQTIGYDVEGTKRTGDQGADLFVERFGRKIVIQAKNLAESVGNSAVQQALAAKAFYGCDDAMVVTNSRFTGSARELAESAGVRLVDREKLQDFLDDYNRALMEDAASRD